MWADYYTPQQVGQNRSRSQKWFESKNSFFRILSAESHRHLRYVFGMVFWTSMSSTSSLFTFWIHHGLQRYLGSARYDVGGLGSNLDHGPHELSQISVSASDRLRKFALVHQSLLPVTFNFSKSASHSLAVNFNVGMAYPCAVKEKKIPWEKIPSSRDYFYVTGPSVESIGPWALNERSSQASDIVREF